MALTYTPAGALTSPIPDFTLPAVVDGSIHTRAGLRNGVTLIAFICSHCPYVRAIEGRLIDLANEYAPRGLNTYAVCSNDAREHPEDAPPELRRRALELRYPFPYLVDETQAVARAFGAVCTPDFFLYGADRRLAYRGRLDDSWREPARVGRRELADAVAACLDGRAVAAEQNSSMGCSIKWSE